MMKLATTGITALLVLTLGCLGCGPAAASFDGRVRTIHAASLERWLAGDPPETDCISETARAAEILAFGMRTTAGWTVAAFQEVTGLDLFAFRGARLRQLRDDGLLTVTAGAVRPTPRGLLLNDLVAETLLSDTLREDG